MRALDDEADVEFDSELFNLICDRSHAPPLRRDVIGGNDETPPLRYKNQCSAANVSLCDVMTVRTALLFSAIKERCEHIHTIRLVDCAIDDEDATEIARMLTANKSVRRHTAQRK